MKLALTIFSLAIVLTSLAQRPKYDEAFLLQKEDSLKVLAEKIQMGINLKDRLIADSLFKRTMVRALKSTHSFYYPFDSIQSVSILYAPDSSFRIFTWQFYVTENLYLQKGAIQMQTWDGNLKLFGLVDRSDVIVKPLDTITDHNSWLGALYYKIIHKKFATRDYYTLLGFDANNIRSDKKVIEILSFVNDKPVFGGRHFSFENDQSPKQGSNRFIMEYKKNGGARLTYDEELDMIVMEHLVPENNEPQKKYTYVGDGDYEGFSWKNGKWVHVEKIFDYKTPEGKPPVPQPINNSGDQDQDKLNPNPEVIKGQPAKPVKKAEAKPMVPKKKG